MAVKYFENGYISLKGKGLLKLTDITLSENTDTDETTSFDSDFSKEYEPGYFGWTASASGILTDDTAEPSKWADVPISGATNAFELIEMGKGRVKYDMILKLDTGNYQKGKVIINSMEVSGSLGAKMTYSLSLQGDGKLTKSATA